MVKGASGLPTTELFGSNCSHTSGHDEDRSTRRAEKLQLNFDASKQLRGQIEQDAVAREIDRAGVYDRFNTRRLHSADHMPDRCATAVGPLLNETGIRWVSEGCFCHRGTYHAVAGRSAIA